MPDLPSIKDIWFTPVLVPYDRPMRTASGTMSGAAMGIVDVVTSSGITGSAYVFAYTPRMLRTLSVLCDDIKDIAIGRKIAPRDRFRDFENAFRLLGVQGLVTIVLAGIDMALWDALGRHFNCPVCEFLEVDPKPIRAYDSYGMVDPAVDGERLERSLKRGFTGIKIKLGGGSLDDDISACRFVRRVIGDDVSLMIDYNQSLTPDAALDRLSALEDFDIYWVEEPVRAEDLAGHRTVRDNARIKVQTGENWWLPASAENALAAGASDYIMPDVMKIGGISGWMSVAKLAADRDIPVSSHAFIEASAHVMAATPTAHWLEYLDKARPLLDEGLDVKDGMVMARGPGLGMEWNRAKIEEFQF